MITYIESDEIGVDGGECKWVLDLTTTKTIVARPEKYHVLYESANGLPYHVIKVEDLLGNMKEALYLVETIRQRFIEQGIIIPRPPNFKNHAVKLPSDNSHSKINVAKASNKISPELLEAARSGDISRVRHLLSDILSKEQHISVSDTCSDTFLLKL